MITNVNECYHALLVKGKKDAVCWSYRERPSALKVTVKFMCFKTPVKTILSKDGKAYIKRWMYRAWQATKRAFKMRGV